MIPISSLTGVNVAAPAPAAAPSTRPVAAAAAGVDPKIAEAAKGFEGVFMSMLVDEMFKGTELTKGNSLYSGLMTEKFGDALAETGGFGFADMLTTQWGGKA